MINKLKKIENYNVLTFSAMEEIVFKYVQEIQNNKPECIVSLNRGGNIPATLLAYKLNINKIIFINMEAYDPKTGKKHETIKFEKPRKKDIVFLKKCKNILIVDDIFDTGASLEKVTDFIDTIKRNQINNDYKIFTLIEKIRSENESVIIKSLRQITYSGIKDDTEDWIVFPWDNDYNYLMRKWDSFNPAINSKVALSGPHIKDLNG